MVDEEPSGPESDPTREPETPANDDPVQQSAAEVLDVVVEQFEESAFGEEALPSWRDSRDEAIYLEAESRLQAGGCRQGCAIQIITFLSLAIFGAVLASHLFDTSSFPWRSGPATSVAAGPGDEQAALGAGSPTAGTATASFLPRDGVWEFENLPFLPACGPGDLGSGFDEGVITVLDDGSRLTATGSREGAASFELVLVEASADLLVYVGTESITGLELTMTFRSPTDLDASIASGGELCLERPAVGAWDRETGAPDPDAEPATAAPPWLPSGFPVSGVGEILTDDAGDTGTFTLLVEDTSPGQVLFEVGTWAAEQGFIQLVEPGTAVVYDMGDGRRMLVDAVAVGSDVELTITVERS